MSAHGYSMDMMTGVTPCPYFAHSRLLISSSVNRMERLVPLNRSVIS